MMNKDCFSALDKTLCDLTGLPDFGGIVMIFTGDWRQTLPVVKRGNEAQIVHACVGTAPFWSNCNVTAFLEMRTVPNIALKTIFFFRTSFKS